MAAEKEEIVLETLDAIACLKSAGNAVTLIWIPSHIGIVGNDKADSLAVSECKSPLNRARDSYLSVSEALAKYKKILYLTLIQYCLLNFIKLFLMFYSKNL